MTREKKQFFIMVVVVFAAVCLFVGGLAWSIKVLTRGENIRPTDTVSGELVVTCYNGGSVVLQEEITSSTYWGTRIQLNSVKRGKIITTLPCVIAPKEIVK